MHVRRVYAVVPWRVPPRSPHVVIPPPFQFPWKGLGLKLPSLVPLPVWNGCGPVWLVSFQAGLRLEGAEERAVHKGGQAAGGPGREGRQVGGGSAGSR